MVLGVPFPETQVVGHDVADEPFVQETAEFLNPFLIPWFPVAEKIRDLRPKFFVQLQVLFESRISAFFHERLLIGKVHDDVIEQFFDGLFDRLRVERFHKREQVPMLSIDLRNIHLESVAPFDDERCLLAILFESHLIFSPHPCLGCRW